MTIRDDIPIFLLVTDTAVIQSVMKPNPPIWMSDRITPCPNVDQCAYVSVKTKPVTQVAEVEVKKEVKSEISSPSCTEIGRLRSNVPSRIMKQYPARRIFVGEILFT